MPQRQVLFICDLCLQCGKNVDYLLMAKPAVRLSTWRSIATMLLVKPKLAVDSLQCRLLILVSYDKNKLIWSM